MIAETQCSQGYQKLVEKLRGRQMPDVGFDVRGQEARGSMDAKRRTVVDPKVRMVGFVTPGTDMPEVAMTQAPGVIPGAWVMASSPSPVIIPPPQ
jgi:hypothetical protein